MKSATGAPMTLGNAAAAGVDPNVWRLDCRHQVEPDPAELAERYGAETTVPHWRDRLCVRRMPFWGPSAAQKRSTQGRSSTSQVQAERG